MYYFVLYKKEWNPVGRKTVSSERKAPPRQIENLQITPERKRRRVIYNVNVR
jgi:hypothetical protein